MKFFEFKEEPKEPQILKPIVNDYQFQYKGITYECIGEDKDFQIIQFKHLIETQDWNTMKNRISNQLMWYPNIKEV